MEIHAVGDRITMVTVNGRVILDGDIRQACKGHNVSEDGLKEESLYRGRQEPSRTLQ